MEIKRYTIMNDYGEDISESHPVENPKGMWVKFKDFDNCLNLLESAVESLNNRLLKLEVK